MKFGQSQSNHYTVITTQWSSHRCHQRETIVLPWIITQLLQNVGHSKTGHDLAVIYCGHPNVTSIHICIPVWESFYGHHTLSPLSHQRSDYYAMSITWWPSLSGYIAI